MTKGLLKKQLEAELVAARAHYDQSEARNADLQSELDRLRTLLADSDAQLAVVSEGNRELEIENALLRDLVGNAKPRQELHFHGPCNVAVGNGVIDNGHGAGSAIAAFKTE